MSRAPAENTVQFVDAVELARTGSTWKCEYMKARFPRLHQAAVSDVRSVSAQLEFAVAERGPEIRGRVAAELQVTCQRCLRPLWHPVEESFELLLLASDEELSDVAESQEALVVDATRLDLHWIVEEQLLLALPLIPKHEDMSVCESASAEAAETPPLLEVSEEKPAAPERQKPFQNLRELLGNKP